ncbi:response regulator receiver domain [Chromobacterium subtsugae]|uniref:response regulator receiver domain n=1 Tax=Chromobacterium subtsugae TaxID=251747 RepID=UPI000A800650|nr:response regulator receiver domain [Chromobacterium subtsugae]
MNEATAAQAVTVSGIQTTGVPDLSDEFIHEAFIVPIRNMVVLDDEYATLDELAGIAEQGLSLDSLDVTKKQNLERVRSLVNLARRHDRNRRPWLVDINNTVVSDVYGHLRNSDLLILDYHLNGDAGGPDDAIKVLQDLAANDDFNIVVVYTKGEQGSIEEVVRQIIVSLTCIELPDFPVDDYESALSAWDDLHGDVYETLVADIKPFIYAKVKSEGLKLERMLQFEECADLNLIVNNNRGKFKLTNKDFILWALHKLKQNSMFSSQFSAEDLGDVSFGIQDELNWIRTKSVFITVVDKKSVAPADLESKLVDAIKMSTPTPHQFLLSKMRSMLLEKGVVAEMEIVGNKSLQRMWLKEFVGEEGSDEISTIDSVVKRHWESLGGGYMGLCRIMRKSLGGI